MLTPTNTRLTPPSGWSVTIEGAGPEIRDNNWSAFITAVRVRLEANSLDFAHWKDDVIDLMCHQRPDIPCEDRELPPVRPVTGAEMRKWIKTLWISLKEGAQAVSPEEMDRRAGICRDCPKRGHVSCFGGCGFIAQALSELVIGTKAPSYPDLHKTACGVCGCEISSLVMFPADVLEKADSQMKFKAQEYPDHCWRKGAQPNMLPNPEGSSSPQPPPAGT